MSSQNRIRISNSLWGSLMSFLGGLAYGGLQGIISGILGQSYWNTDAAEYVLFFSSGISIAIIVGAVASGPLVQPFGKKWVYFWSAIVAFVCTVLASTIPHPLSAVIFRSLSGFGVGCITGIASSYGADLASPAKKSLVSALFQVSIGTGFLMAYIINALLDTVTYSWRIQVGVASVFPLLIAIATPFAPESPSWLDQNEKRGKKAKQHEKSEEMTVDTETNEEATAQPNDDQEQVPASKPRISAYAWVICIVLAILYHTSGINAVFFFAPNLFSSFNLSRNIVLWLTVALGTWNQFCAFVPIALLRVMNLKWMLVLGTSIQLIGTILNGVSGVIPSGAGSVGLALAGSAIALLGFSLGIGTLFFVYLGQLLGSSSGGSAISMALVWSGNLVIVLTNSALTSALGQGGYYFLLAGITLILVLFSLFAVRSKDKKQPETNAASEQPNATEEDEEQDISNEQGPVTPSIEPEIVSPAPEDRSSSPMVTPNPSPFEAEYGKQAKIPQTL
ncbi:Sugar Porter (MFS) [Blattamonas nauphoetae]|uniref:Sugar Porter (MFS) n=1 Tax=Blattamonas nauphoetae TaxID=2049346 RepID=A0ABQ9YGC2_9EUKA|nr:Sugar Porter (MFS) [Blattamonas nauphoetae]